MFHLTDTPTHNVAGETEDGLISTEEEEAKERINRKPSGGASVPPLPASSLLLLYYFIKRKSCQGHTTPSLVQSRHSTLSRLNYNLITEP